MNTRHVRVCTVLTFIAGATASASAAAQQSPWSVSILGGDSVATAGSLRAPGTATVTDLGALDPALAGSSGTLSLDKLRYEDLFRRRYDTGLELDYSFSHSLQTYGRFSYEGLGGRTRSFGELTSASLASPSMLSARFADADNTSLELGSRYLLFTGTSWRPFAGVSLGATHLDAIRASLTSPDLSLDLQNVRFTRPGTVFSQSLEAGVEYDPSSSFGVRFSADAQHVGTPPSANDPALASLGLNAGNDARSRWAFPVSIAAAYYF
jgi:hypothetical protein